MQEEYHENPSTNGGELHPVVCDVLSESDIQKTVKTISYFDETKPSRPFLAVVNNAGFCMISPMELTSSEDIKVVIPTPRALTTH